MKKNTATEKLICRMKLGIPAAALFVFLATAGMISAEESVFFNPYTEYLEDTSGSITFDEIKKKESYFQENRKPVPLRLQGFRFLDSLSQSGYSLSL